MSVFPKAALLFLAAVGCAQSAVVVLSEGFSNVAGLTASGWAMQNNSTGPGSILWFQGNPAVFDAQSGAANSYAAANFNAASFGGNISDWLLLPTEILNNGDILSFYTRTEGAVPGDNLEVRLSTNGSSANVGATTSSFGDFSTLLLTVNSGSYPTSWTQYTITLSGLAGATTGRLAFRYLVTDTSANGDYIGIDTVTLTSSVPEPATTGLVAVAVLGAFYGKQRFSRIGRSHE